MEEIEENSPIQKFYKSRNVFITGGTGFMGKILVEKLLRSTEVSTLYILVREKKGKHVHSRIDELFDDVIFDRLKKECPKYRNRIETVPGDCTLSGLGLDIIDRQKLTSCIDIVFHLAATVRFNENLKIAYNVNVNATKEIIELAKQMKNLKSIVHVSTAYSHCPRDDIEEKFYDCPVSCDQISDVIQKLSKKEAEYLEPKIIKPWPNTYTFTKALAEQFVQNSGKSLPIGIFRPSIITSTYKEPIPGWIDNLYGPTGITAGCMSGVLRVAVLKQDYVADIVPVDVCVAGLVATAWDVAQQNSERISQDIPIYNYVSGPENPVTWQEFVQINYLIGQKIPLLNTLWIPFIATTSSIPMYLFYMIIYHFIPGFIMDLLLVVTGHKPRMLSMYRKVQKFTETVVFFSTKNFSFTNKNIVGLWQKMSNKDKELFPLSMLNVHWLIYLKGYVRGIRRFLLKCPDDNIEEARERHKRLSLIDKVLRVILVILACNTLTLLVSKLYNIIFYA